MLIATTIQTVYMSVHPHVHVILRCTCTAYYTLYATLELQYLAIEIQQPMQISSSPEINLWYNSSTLNSTTGKLYTFEVHHEGASEIYYTLNAIPLMLYP